MVLVPVLRRRVRLLGVAAGLALALLASGSVATSDYVVRPGDTLSGIAVRHGTTWRELLRLNPQISDPNRIRAGTTIRLVETPAATTGPVVLPGMAQPDAGGTYTARSGDSLARIATRYGLTWAELWLLNPQITQPHLLRPGMVVRLPDWPTSGSTIASVTAYGPTGRATASGKAPARGMAASNTLPFGTVVSTSAGFSVVIEDRIGCCSDLDIFMPTEAEARRFGRQTLRIWW